MAILFSENQLNFARKKYYGKFYFNDKNINILKATFNKILILIYNIKVSLINKKRYIFRNITKPAVQKSNNHLKIELNVKGSNLEALSNKLKNNNCAFVENFFDNKSYNQILANWPNINFFEYRNKIIKSYSAGFRYANKKILEKDLGTFNKNKIIKEFYDFLLSADFNKYINSILKFENSDFNIYSIGSTIAGTDSYLIPHIDGVMKRGESAYNFIYFVDGNDADIEFSGGTGIYEDADFEKPLLIPSTLKNSMLIYNSSHEFYHGFKLTKLPKNFYRKTINFQFFKSG